MMHQPLTAEQQQALTRLQEFTAKRNKVSITLSAIILLAYYLFILGVGLFPKVLGTKISDSYITIGIFSGISIILLCIITTGIYTWVANTRFDKQQQSVVEQINACHLPDYYQK